MGVITAELVDTGEKRDTRGRRVTPRERRLHLVQEYRGSGLTMAAFARRESVKYSTLAGWVAKAPRAVLAKSPIKFAEVRLPLAAPSPPPGDQLEVRLPDGTVLRGGRVADVVALARALRS
jgi:transposase-like protein